MTLDGVVGAALPADGPLGELARRATVLMAPHDVDRPWVLADGDRVVKAYDLRALDDLDRRAALSEARIAVEMGRIPGVVPTLRAEVEGAWLVIEMERMDATLAEHLAAVASHDETAIDPAAWGRLLAGVASTLEALHRRGIVHRDVKPANLLFDAARQRLLVADFSIALPGRRRRMGLLRQADRKGESVAGTDRFIAPEQFDGRVGPAADQYALGIVASDVLGSAADDGAVRHVLLRATAQEPDERYASVGEMGTALRAALDPRSPHRVSSRLERVAPRWRTTWGTATYAAVGTWALLLLLRPEGINAFAGLWLPLLAFALAAMLGRTLGGLRGERTQPRFAIADRPWFPLAVLVMGVVAIAPFVKVRPDEAVKWGLLIVFGAFALSAFLGSASPHAGAWAIALVRRWERRRERHRERPARRWGGRLALVTALAAVSALPAAVAERWPAAPSPPDTAAGYGPPRAAAAFRGALLARDSDRACRAVRIVQRPDGVRCEQWALLASRWLLKELRDERIYRFTPAQMHELSVRGPFGREIRAPMWTFHPGEDEPADVGSMGPVDEARRVWMVEVPRHPPNEERLGGPNWRYEVSWRGGRWWITSVEVCDTRADPSCVQLTQLRRAQMAKLRTDGPPRSG